MSESPVIPRNDQNALVSPAYQSRGLTADESTEIAEVGGEGRSKLARA